MFNHEGTRRGLDFVTRKTTNGIAKIKVALERGLPLPILELGNIDSQRDWSDAEDFMEGVWAMLNAPTCTNYVLASGEMHTVRHFIEEALKYAEIEFLNEGEGEGEKFYALTDGGKELIIQINPKFYRPAEVHELLGDASKAHKELGWKGKTSFKELVIKMVERDLGLLRKE